MSDDQDLQELTNIRRAALNLLARRDHSQHELTQKLKLKRYTPTLIHHVVTELKNAGYINEERFVESYIHWRKTKGFGPVRIRLELQARGISDDLLETPLQIRDESWLEQARKIWEKHFNHPAKDNKQQAKQIRFLQYRGYTQEQIDYALDE